MIKKTILIILLLVLAAVMFISPDQRLHFTSLALIVILTIFARALPSLKTWHTTLEIITLYFVLNFFYQVTRLYNLFFLTHMITLWVFFLYLVLIKKYVPVRALLRAGKIRKNLLPALGFTLLSVIFLGIWFINQSGNPHAQYMPDLSVGWLVPLGIGFALLNGLYEESLFRGILFPAFTESTGFLPAVFMQAIWFSFLHYQAGFPSGMSGIALTFIFAMMMAALLKRSRGLLLPILVHALTDFTIFIMIWLRINQLL